MSHPPPPRTRGGRAAKRQQGARDWRDRRRRGVVAVALGCSILAHVVLLVVFLPPHFDSPAPVPEEKPFEVTTTSEDALPDDAPLEAAARVQEREEQEREEQDRQEVVQVQVPEEPDVPEELKEEPVEQPEEPEEIAEPLPPPELPEENMKLVQQVTNEEAPDKADFLSQQANRVEEETRAEETITLDVLAGDTVPEDLTEETGGDPETSAEDEAMVEDAPLSAGPSEALSAQEVTPPKALPTPPEPAERPLAERAQPAQETPVSEADSPAEHAQESMFRREQAASAPSPPPRSLFVPDAREYDKLFAEGDQKQAAGMKAPAGGRRLLAGWKDNERAMRASLENTITEVRPGNHTGVNASASVYADFIARIHRKLHPLWGAGFLPRLDGRYPAGHPLSNPRLEVTLEYVIDGGSGAVDAVNIVRTSGQMLFDGEGVVVFNQIGPHTHAPPEIISPDGKVYIHWTLWRDEQQCGPWGATIFIVDKGSKQRVDAAGRRVSDG